MLQKQLVSKRLKNSGIRACYSGPSSPTESRNPLITAVSQHIVVKMVAGVVLLCRTSLTLKKKKKKDCLCRRSPFSLSGQQESAEEQDTQRRKDGTSIRRKEGLLDDKEQTVEG